MGLIVLSTLQWTLSPDISPTQVKIILKLPGSSPEEMENNIVRPLELELLGLKGQKSLRSVSKYSISDITIDFDDSVDIYLARNIVNERLSGVMKDLPVGVEGAWRPLLRPYQTFLCSPLMAISPR
ncbi:efflux RND transporter permease subunit [Helicobacter pylori]